MFGGFVFVVVFLPHFFALPVCEGVVFVDASFLVSCFGQIFSDLNSALPVVVGGFCLESLILAQDERWRRA